MADTRPNPDALLSQCIDLGLFFPAAPLHFCHFQGGGRSIIRRVFCCLIGEPDLIITEPAVGYRLIEKEPTVQAAAQTAS